MGPQTRRWLITPPSRPRLRPVSLALGVGALLLAAGSVAGAQTPPPPPPPPDSAGAPGDSLVVGRDTIPVETIPVDTIASDTIPVETLKPVHVVAPFRPGAEPRWTAGGWEWDREALLRSSALTLTDLLAQIPGVTSVRSGFIGHPESVALAGGTGGYTEIYLDGFALDPLDGPSYDLSRLELVHLDRVRVERRGGGLRIDLETIAPVDHRPYSMVEAGTGEYGARMVRGTFMTPHFLAGPLSLGIERLEGSGLFRSQPANTFTGWLKWARGIGATTLQFELRRNTVEWSTAEQLSMKGHRQDWVARARTKVTSGLTTEAFLGGSGIEDEYHGNPGTAVERKGLQGGLRALYRGDALWATATLRGRNQELLPRVEADAAAGLTLLDRLHLSGDINHSAWRDGREGRSWGARAELEPILGVRPFVEWSSGTRGIPGIWTAMEVPGAEDAEDDDLTRTILADRAILSERKALRAGGELAWRGLRLGAAWNRVEADSIADFGLPFDRTGTLFPGGVVNGIEVNGRVPLLWAPLWIEGWYTRWSGAEPWIYLPQQTLRTALVYHDSPLPSGNLEISARLELSNRSGMLVPALIDPAAGPGSGGRYDIVPGWTSLDFYLQIRVLDVRAFVRWNNITHRLDHQDLPGRIFPGQRTFYGVKWQFWD